MAKIRVFTLNANGKIELSKAELERLLNEAYEDGLKQVTITTPSYPINPSDPYSPFYYSTTATGSNQATTGKITTATNNTEN